MATLIKSLQCQNDIDFNICPRCKLSFEPKYVHIGEDLRLKCPKCLGELNKQKIPDRFMIPARASDNFQNRKPIAVMILHGLHACGSAKRCLTNCRTLIENGLHVVLVAVRGGGIWADKFSNACHQMFFLKSEVLSPSTELVNILENAEFIEVHYQPAISWLFEHLPNSEKAKIDVYFHTEAVGLFDDKSILEKAIDRSTRLLFPTHYLLLCYQKLINSNLKSKFVNKSLVSPNFVEFSQVDSNECEEININHFGVKGKRIAIVTRLDSDKTCPVLMAETLKAMLLRDPEIRVSIVGPGEDTEEMLAGISDLIENDIVRVFGYIDNVSIFYKWCDLIFLPSWTEVYPYVVLEAAHWGKLSVLPNLRNLEDALTDVEPRPIYFLQRDSNSAADAISQVLKEASNDE